MRFYNDRSFNDSIVAERVDARGNVLGAPVFNRDIWGDGEKAAFLFVRGSIAVLEETVQERFEVEYSGELMLRLYEDIQGGII